MEIIRSKSFKAAVSSLGGYNPAMAAHRQIDGVYQWELSIPPDSAAALLRAVCVDLDDPNSHYLGHVLLGPKTWQIRFMEAEFELRPLASGGLYLLVGTPRGLITATKSGSVVQLRLSDRFREHFYIFAAAAIGLSIAYTATVFALLADRALWIRVTVSTALIAWSALAWLWLLPRHPLWNYLSFLDDLFADYIVSGEDEESPSPPVTKTACAK